MPMLDMVIVGAGFAGMYLLHKARGQGLRTRAFEAGPDVGGTWYWNRYPGARCDVESLEYSYSFMPELEHEWEWTERFATQPEILRYINFVADKLDLRSGFTFNTTVTAAHWSEEHQFWTVTTGGETLTTRYLVLATGCLSTASKPNFPGMDSFQGEILHTGTWPASPPQLAGKRVGVIGTGSSGVQVIPELAKVAGALFVFQRTPHFCVPARNAPIPPQAKAHWRENFSALRKKARTETRSGWLADPAKGKALDFSPEERRKEYDWRWEKGGGNFLYAFNDIGSDPAANATAADYVRERIRAAVTSPALAQKLTPHGYPIGAKRITVGTNFYETFNQDNVTLVDVAAAPITGLTKSGIATSDAVYPLDVIVFATGFDAMTGAILKIDITSHAGALRDAWAAGPVNLMGLMVHGFPNLFTVTGPGSPSVLSNVLMSIEQHVEYIADMVAYANAKGLTRIEADETAQANWVAHCADVADTTLMGGANSWYLGANVPGKPRVFLPYIGGVDRYRQHCETVKAEGYRGFSLSGADPLRATA